MTPRPVSPDQIPLGALGERMGMTLVECSSDRVVTDHSNIDYTGIVEKSRLIVDTRNTTRKLKNSPADDRIIRL